MMFTNTISVSNIYFTSSVVIVPIIWLCMTVVVVVISFSIIMYRRRRSWEQPGRVVNISFRIEINICRIDPSRIFAKTAVLFNI